MKMPRCTFCGKKAKKEVTIPGHIRLTLCNYCIKIMKQEMAKRGMVDLGKGMSCPADSVLMTVAEYGTPFKLEYVSAAVHQGSKVIESEVYSTKELTLEEIERRIDGLHERHPITAVMALDERVPVEFHECGGLVIRIADGKGRTLPNTYMAHECN